MTWIVEHADGSVTQHFDKPGTAANPDAGKRCAQTPRLLATDGSESWSWSGSAIVGNVAAVQAQLVAAVKAEGERRAMLIYTSGRAKMKKYSRKQQEVLDWYQLGPNGAVASVLVTALNALPAAAKKRKFRFAQADAARRGDTVADAIARFEAGIAASEDGVADMEAIEQTTVAAIKAATTVAGARAAAAAADWTWRSA